MEKLRKKHGLMDRWDGEKDSERGRDGSFYT